MSDPHAPADGDADAFPPPPWASPNGVGGPPPASSFSAPRRHRGWRIFGTVVLVFVVLVGVAAFVASRVSVNYYVITPGDATPVSQYIEVPAQDNHPLTGTILLTDVFLTPLNAYTYLRYRYFDSDSEVISGSLLLGSTANESQYLDQGYLEMAQAQSFATAAALTHLGYTVPSTNAGTLVFGIQPGSPAGKALQVGQIITAVGDKATPTDCALVDALHGYQPGTSVPLTVEKSSITENGDFVGGPTVQMHVTLGPPPKGLVETGCGPPTKPTAFLGIDPETQLDFHFPIAVTVHTSDIGGPSAGLAMTLGIIDKLTSGRLTGHRIVAATGTMDQYGNIGDVGGVAEKTIAVERAGATVFFVPTVEKAAAESKATPQLHVYAVNNLNQVLAILEKLGGHVTTNPAPAQAAP
jgi:PDZ domain-containing protein